MSFPLLSKPASESGLNIHERINRANLVDRRAQRNGKDLRVDASAPDLKGDLALIAGCRTESEAIRRMVFNSGRQKRSIADQIGVGGPWLSRAMNGDGRLQEGQLRKLMEVCGSHAWLHYWLNTTGYDARFLRRLQTGERAIGETGSTLDQEKALTLKLLREALGAE